MKHNVVVLFTVYTFSRTREEFKMSQSKYVLRNFYRIQENNAILYNEDLLYF